MATSEYSWWKDGVCYQVWPASFKDSNDDGFGDLQGVISKLDYLKELGVDYIWLSPMYDSPRHDMGYDIRNYEDVDEDFGTLDDMDALIKEVHDRGMRLILDLVANHTSNEHKWFQESMKSKDNEYSDYYLWRDPKIVDGKKQPPNNWASLFGGSAWKYVEARDQYYLHLFLESQPDLNWELEKVRKAIYQTAIRFWLDKGIDGFRVDTINLYSKNLDFPDGPIKDPKDEFQMPEWADVINGPRMHEWLQEQRNEAIAAYGDIVLVGELGFASEANLLQYLDPKTREIDMIFDFEVVINSDEAKKPPHERNLDFSLSRFRKGFAGPQNAYSQKGLWATVFLENHDQPRSVSKFGSQKPENRWKSAKLIALMLSTLSGTLFIYQGQEIGMSNVPTDWPITEFNDPAWIKYIQDMEKKYPDDTEMEKKVWDTFQKQGRDHARTPVQWSPEEPYAGFSKAKPWLRVNDNFREGVNVAEQQTDEASLLSFWKKSVAFRKANMDVLNYGHTEWFDKDNEKVLIYTKKSTQGKTMLVVLNFSDDEQSWQPPKEVVSSGNLKEVLGTGQVTGETTKLAPWEGRVLEC